MISKKHVDPTLTEDGPWETNELLWWCTISHDAPFTQCSPFKPFLTYSPEARSSVQRDVLPWKPLNWKTALPEIQPTVSSDSCADPGFTDLQEQHPSDSANNNSWAFHSSLEGIASHMLFLPKVQGFGVWCSLRAAQPLSKACGVHTVCIKICCKSVLIGPIIMWPTYRLLI